MGDPHAFAVDVFRIVCDRLEAKAADLRLMVETTSSFEEWLNWEAFLACKLGEPSYPFCEVAAKPSYSSEGVVDDGGGPDRKQGDLRVGGSYDADDHRWVFAEFALLHDGNRTGDEWRRKIEADAAKLKRLGWRRSASLLVLVAASRGDVPTEWAGDLANFAAWNQPALADPFALALLGGGSVVIKAFDVKRDPAHTLTMTTR
ncbi:MAG: hypothetical protein JWO38_3034 [Gemmataceae bacterium]|nr:hypothetical protein [Gemmataceae bacterium]